MQHAYNDEVIIASQTEVCATQPATSPWWHWLQPVKILLFSALLLRAQPPPQEVVIRSHPYIPPPTSPLTAETNLVETILVVRDAKGQPVGGFRASEFQLLDNGKPQQILSFVETKLPEPGTLPSSTAATNKSVTKSPAARPTGKAVTLFFDDLHTDSPELLRSIGATRKFVTSALQPADRLAIVTSSGTADQDFTSDPALIEAKLDQIHTHVRQPVASCPALTPVDAYLLIKGVDADVKQQATEQAQICLCGSSADPGCMNSKTTLATAPGLAQSAAETVWSQVEGQSSIAVAAIGEAVRRLAAVNGPRIMVLISSGFLPPLAGQKSMMDPIVTAALRWNIVIHSLDAKSLDPERETINGSGNQSTRIDRTQMTRRTALWEPLEKVSKGTGGHFFHNNNDLAAALQMATAPSISYQVSFNPGARDGQFHNLKIAFKNKVFYSLQFRPGYFSPPEVKKEPLNRAALDAAVFSKQTLREIPAAVTLAAGPPSEGTIPLSISVLVDVKQLQFTTDAGRHIQQIVFLTTLLDAGNSFVTGKEAVMDLSLTDEKLASLQKDGLKAVTTISVPAGIYHVRTVIREAMKGSLAASTIPIDLRPN